MELKKNRTKEKLESGGVCFGTMIRLTTSAQVIPLSASAGWDYVILDTEHCDYNIETLSALALVAKYEEVTFLVRVPDKLYHQMAQALDVGAEGLVIPRVETVEQSERIVDSVKYFPLGHRGASVSSIATLMRDCSPKTYLEWANNETLVVVQIESGQGVDLADEMLSKPGIDAVMIGPFDLSQDLGVPGEVNHPKVHAACERVIESCVKNGVAPGIHVSRLEDAARWVERGMRFISYQYDTKFLLDASRQAVAELKKLG